MDTALYFPYMRVPDSSWFTQVILYWDQAASIVPYSYKTDDVELGEYMMELSEYELLTLMDPRLPRDPGPFDVQFFQLLKLQELPGSRESWRWTRVHSHKASFGLFRELRQRGLAHREDGRVAWWRVEERTANLYMAYLAGSMCRAHPNMFPVTDTIQSLESLGPAINIADKFKKLQYITITEALPIPTHPVSPAELARFKNQNRDKLGRLRRYLSGQLADIAAIDDDYLRNLKADAAQEQIRDEIADLREQMSRRRWPEVILCGVGGVVAAGLGAGTSFATGGTALALGLGIGAGTVSMGRAAYQAVDLLRTPALNPRSPLAYAALAEAL